jgi:hypothetical protein
MGMAELASALAWHYLIVKLDYLQYASFEYHLEYHPCFAR